MSKDTKNAVAVTEAAQRAGTKLSAFAAVEASAKNLVKAAEAKDASEDFAEFHFSKNRTMAVIKVGNVVTKIES